MESKQKKTAVEVAQEKAAKEAMKPSSEMYDPATGAKEGAQMANVSITKHHDKEAIASKGRVAAFSADHVADVKTLDDDVLTDEQVEARMPKLPSQPAPLGIAPLKASGEPRNFDQNEHSGHGISVEGEANANQAVQNVKKGK